MLLLSNYNYSYYNNAINEISSLKLYNNKIKEKNIKQNVLILH